MAESKSTSDNEKKHELISHWAVLLLANLDKKIERSLNKAD